MTGINQLLGKVLTKAELSADKETLVFEATDGSEYVMQHHQDCCESVACYDVCGDLSDLIGNPILQADESSNSEEYPPDVPVPEYTDSYTWTFYRIATIKGGVTLRWLGESNGYYGESVDVDCVKEPTISNPEVSGQGPIPQS